MQTFFTFTLSHGYQTVIDGIFFNEVMKRRWYALKTNNGKIVCVSYGKKPIYLHRLIYEMAHGALDKKQQLTHRDGDSLNNRLSNLKVITHNEKKKNVGINLLNKSGYKGVYFHKKAKKWVAYIYDRSIKKSVHIGLFTDKSIAAIEFDKKAIEIGQTEYLNFL
jgi:pyruvate/oxaloacetate carboxyltransferase